MSEEKGGIYDQLLLKLIDAFRMKEISGGMTETSGKSERSKSLSHPSTCQ